MTDNNVNEIYKEARKAGLQTALWLMFAMFIVNSLLFGFFIYKSFETPPTGQIEATMDNQNGNNTITQEVK